MRRSRLAVLTSVAAATGCLLVTSAAPARDSAAVDAAGAGPLDRVLVFSKTAGFRHSSIPNGIAAIQELGRQNGFAVDATEDATRFTDANLAQYDVVVFLSTTGDVLDDTQQAAFERYIGNGNGYAGIHAAADTEYGWSWYGEMLGGAYFDSHPAIQQADVVVEDGDEPSTSHLPARWTRTDEWYNYQANPRDAGVHVLATLDESSYSGGNMGADHPIAWCSDFDGGRAWYTGGGHTEQSFTDGDFLQHILGGLRTAAGAEAADCGAARVATPRAIDFEKVTLDDDTANPMELDIADDGRVFYIERDGRVQILKPATGTTVLAGVIPVTLSQENGLLGIQLAPDFEQSGWVYLFYSALPDSSNTQVIARFKVENDQLDLQSEQRILTFLHQRAQCCHSAGSLYFGPDASLYISTGDNTNPFASDGYTPIDERPGREAWDAQRTSANTNELNGKILRIKPLENPIGEPGVGRTYTIPEGNLFAESLDAEDKTRPEIFAMGFRNPFRFTVDPETGWVLMGDYGPDAGSTNPNRGPQGSVEYNTVTEAGNYGWPYCIRDNTAYNDYDFATATSGPKFDCAAPVNDSPNNTGLRQLPPAVGADAWMGYTEEDPRHTPDLGTGGAPMGGPRYHFDPDNPSETKFPAIYDGLWFNGEWNKGWIKTFELDAQGGVVDVAPFALGTGYKRPMDLDFGPDGSLYVIEWGSGFGGNNADSGIYRIDYRKGDRRPIARATATPDSGPAPLEVQFSSEGSTDPEGTALAYEWDFGDGTTSTQPDPAHTYTQNGSYTASLRVTDQAGESAIDNVRVVVGNTRPEVTLETPSNGQFAAAGDPVPYRISVADREDGATGDGSIDCTDVTLNVSLGHDEHAHELSEATGCAGTVEIAGSGGHAAEANTFTVIEAVYTDSGAPGAPALTGRDEVVLQPKRKQAEHYSSTGRTADARGGGDPGVERQTTGDPQGGGQNIAFIEDGDYVSYRPMNLEDIDSLTFRVASQLTGGRIDVRLDAADGPLLAGTGDILPTGGWQTYQNVTLDIPDSSGTHELFLVFRNPSLTGSLTGTGALMNVNWIDFTGDGAANLAPQVSASADPTGGAAPLEVRFDGEATDPDGKPGDTLSYHWDFGVEGTDADTSTELDPVYTYEQPGTYTATFTATDRYGASASATAQVRVGRNRVLVFSKTAGFRHASIPAGIAAIRALGAEHGFGVDATEDAAQFTDQNLARYGAVLWLSTTGDVLNEDQQAAFERYIRGGGGYVGIHAAADTEYGWAWYGRLVGAYFRNHPFNQTATVRVEDREHPSTRNLPESYQRLDEWYNYRSPESSPGGADYSPRGTVHVLASVDELSYFADDGSLTPDDHPISWCRRYDGGRSWYTGMGHTNESYTEANFLEHVLGGIRVAMGAATSEPCGNRAPAVTASAAPTSGRAPLTVSFTADGSDPDGDQLDYVWDFGDGSVSQERNPDHTYSAPGTYTARVTATDPWGETAGDEIAITVAEPNRAPSVTASADPTSGRVPLTVSFAASGSDPDGDALEYLWEYGDGETSTAQNPSHTYRTTGTYTAKVTVSDDWGGTATDEVVIRVEEPNRPPTVTVSAQPTSGTAPLTVSFTANGSDPNGDELTYAWSFGDGTTSSERNPTHTYATRGTYTAEIVVTDPEGLVASDHVHIEVKGRKKPPR